MPVSRWGRMRAILYGATAASLVGYAAASCFHLGDCNGHGTCNSATSTCVCDDGWGSASDIAIYKAPDCSQRTWRISPRFGLSELRPERAPCAVSQGRVRRTRRG
jgi:hypothetical protein